VRVEAGDVTGDAAVARIVVEAAARNAPLKGVVHAAGVLEDALLRDASRDSLERVLAPKVAGALALDRATAGEDLDWFLALSSISAWLGVAGQAAYGAGNGAMDGLARDRRARGLPALSVALGPLEGDGMAARIRRCRAEQIGLAGSFANREW